jgi:hypothetical protein
LSQGGGGQQPLPGAIGRRVLVGTSSADKACESSSPAFAALFSKGTAGFHADSPHFVVRRSKPDAIRSYLPCRPGHVTELRTHLTCWLARQPATAGRFSTRRARLTCVGRRLGRPYLRVKAGFANGAGKKCLVMLAANSSVSKKPIHHTNPTRERGQPHKFQKSQSIIPTRSASEVGRTNSKKPIHHTNPKRERGRLHKFRRSLPRWRVGLVL